MPLLRLGLLFLVFLGCPANAESKSAKNFFFIEAGAYVNNLKERLNAPPGYAGKVSTLTGYLRIHPGFSLGKNWRFEPSLGTAFPRSGNDGANLAFETHLALQLSFPLWKIWFLRLGPGLEWICMLSKEQTVPLNNGTGESNFATPARASHMFLFTGTLGFTFRIHDRWMIGLDLYVPDALSSLRRRYNASLTLGFRL